MRQWLRIFLVFALLVSMGVAGQDKIPEQRPMVIIEDAFQFISGTWADYTIFDKKKNEEYRFYFAVLEKEQFKGKPCFWLEIEVEMEGSPRVVTRVLTEETKLGPGELMKAIVFLDGYAPFRIPKSFLEGEDAQIGQFEPARIVKRFETKTIRHKDKEITAWVVEAETQEGETIEATVSLELPPMTIYEVEDSTVRMTINDWGSDAMTKIEGKPLSFWFWLIEQIK